MGEIFQQTTPYGNCMFNPFLLSNCIFADGPGQNNWFGGLEIGVNCGENEHFVGSFTVGQEGFPTGLSFSILYSGINMTSPQLPYQSDNSEEIGTLPFVGGQFATAIGFSGFLRINIQASVSFNGNYPGFFKQISLEAGNFIFNEPPPPPDPCDCCCCGEDMEQ